MAPRWTSTVRRIPVSQITADSGQPRQTFDRTALGELAASIRANGLLQPITVRQVGADAYQIIAGERRFRATEINGSATIRAIVVEPTDAADIRVKQIIENDQRVDVTPLEQARSYQALMDETGWTVEELGQHIGKAPHRITERTVLLKLASEYQSLLASGNLKPSEATELARLTPRAACTTFDDMVSSGCTPRAAHDDDHAYQIIAGERRFRATEINGSATIRAIVVEPTDAADIRVKQIIENDQRVDVTPLEQARSYQALMDETGWTVEELGQHIGKAPHRITERTVLLKLASEYQSLLASGNLKPSEATELARLTPRAACTTFDDMVSSGCTPRAAHDDDHDEQHDQTNDAEAAEAVLPAAVSVIPPAHAPEQQHQNYHDQEQAHESVLQLDIRLWRPEPALGRSLPRTARARGRARRGKRLAQLSAFPGSA